MNKRDFPKIHFYDQDFVDIYDKTWTWIQDYWTIPATEENSTDGYFIYPQDGKLVLDQLESLFASFFLVYSNRNYPAYQNIDYFYSRQEANGAIRCKYDVKDDKPVTNDTNPEGIGIPLFAWAEFNLYHKSGNKRRIKEIMPVLQKYMDWIDTTFKQKNGLYAVPAEACGMYGSPRPEAYYPVDFNALLAVNAMYMAALGDILNDKDINFQYKRQYFSLKTRINSMMWDDDTAFYHDLNEQEQRLPQKTLAGFFPLLAEMPNEDRATQLIAHLNDPATFGTDHPFPSLSADSPDFSQQGDGFHGSVYPPFNFMVIKGLEKYQKWDIARECAIRHLYYMIDAMFPNNPDIKGDLWEAYQPCKEGVSITEGDGPLPRKRYLHYAALSTIALMIENVIGLSISLPRKTVDWIIPNLEIMGIENLALKRNLITILSAACLRGIPVQESAQG